MIQFIKAFFISLFANPKQLKTTITGLIVAIPAIVYGIKTHDWNEYVVTAISTGILGLIMPDLFTKEERQKAKDDFKNYKKSKL
jgi:ABC-type phosphate transport system permease subunit